MMRKTFIALVAGLLLAACAEKAPERGALILGEATGFNPQDTIVAFFSKFEGNSGRSIARDTLRDGHFRFRLDLLPEGAEYYSLSFEKIKNGKFEKFLGHGSRIYLEPGVRVRMQGEGRYYKNAQTKSPLRDQKLHDRFMKKISLEDWKANQDNQLQWDELLDEIEARYDERASWTEAYRDSVARLYFQLRDSRPAISDRILRQELELLQTEEIGAFALSNLESLAHEVSLGKKEYREGVIRAYGRLTEEQKASPDGIAIMNYLNPSKQVYIGDPVPEAEFVDLEGHSVRLSDFQGKWVLVDFWMRSCGPCIKAVPELGVLSRELQDKLAVVSISMDKESTWRKASEEHGITWNNWNDPKGPSGIFRAYGTNAFPTFVLISPEGTVDYIMTGYAEGKLRSLAALIK